MTKKRHLNNYPPPAASNQLPCKLFFIFAPNRSSTPPPQWMDPRYAIGDEDNGMQGVCSSH